MSENIDKQCVLELCYKKTKAELREILAESIGVTVIGYTICCDMDGCTGLYNPIEEKWNFHGTCDALSKKYAVPSSTNNIPL